jgi:hypothetical protein
VKKLAVSNMEGQLAHSECTSLAKFDPLVDTVELSKQLKARQTENTFCFRFLQWSHLNLLSFRRFLEGARSVVVQS